MIFAGKDLFAEGESLWEVCNVNTSCRSWYVPAAESGHFETADIFRAFEFSPLMRVPLIAQNMKLPSSAIDSSLLAHCATLQHSLYASYIIPGVLGFKHPHRHICFVEHEFDFTTPLAWTHGTNFPYRQSGSRSRTNTLAELSPLFMRNNIV